MMKKITIILTLVFMGLASAVLADLSQQEEQSALNYRVDVLGLRSITAKSLNPNKSELEAYYPPYRIRDFTGNSPEEQQQAPDRFGENREGFGQGDPPSPFDAVPGCQNSCPEPPGGEILEPLKRDQPSNLN